MKVLGIGIDIESVERFNKLTIKKNSLFLNKIYTKRELQYCFSHKNPAPYLAARFAGKEAVIKAITASLNKIISAKDIEITNAANGLPIAKIPKTVSVNMRIHISLSHSDDQAIAFVLIQEKTT